MGPMVRGEKLNKRRLTKLAVLGIIAMFTWSLIAAPESVGQDAGSATEPEEISSYFTFADASPIAGYVDHQALPAPAFGPGLAHTTTTVELPSEASAIAWLTDFGIANGLHGTTTGASVPTEVNAKQPGGDPKGEFTTAGGPVGEEEFGRVAAGVARATAVTGNAPRGFGTAYFSDVCLFPAAGSPPEPPGTYDPDATFPGGDNQTAEKDPGPLARQCIVSAASIASTSQSIRENDTVTSIGVAEIEGITIGDRTSDNRCTNCFYIDAMRVEAFAQSNGQPGGSKAGYRLMFGRACRRAFVPGTTDTIREAFPPPVGEEAPSAHEEDQCLGNPSREGFPEGNADAGDEVLNVVPAKDLNAFFDKPLVLGEQPCPGSTQTCRIAIRVNAGERNVDPARAERTSSPPEDVCRNYAYPDPNPKAKEDPDCKKYGVPTGTDKDQGQEAKAVAEGLDIDILTLTATQAIPPNEDLETCLEGQIPAELYDNEAFGSLYGAVKEQVGCPIAGLRSVRELNLTFGIAQAAAVARPNVVLPDGGAGGGDGGGLGGIVPPVTGPVGGGDIGGGGGGGVQVIGGGGFGEGKYGLKIDWKSFKIKPWPAGDLAKALFAGAIIAGMVLLIRRRLRQA